jgi:cytoskeleton protein RodZ
MAMTRPTNLPARQGVARSRPVRLRDVSLDGEAPLATIGQELRNSRIARGEDLASVSYALKIRKDHLEAIEDDRFDALPGRTYAVGFVRAYAEYVGIDAAEAVERFKMEIAGRDEVSRTAGFPEEIEEPGLSRGWLLMAILVAGLLVYGVYYLFASGSPEAREPVSAVPKQMTAAQHNLASPKRPHPVAPAPKPGSSTVSPQTNASSAAPAVAPGPGGQVYGQMNTNAHVVLRAKHATRILVQTEDGRAFINKVLQPGDIYQVPNMRGLALTAEHGNAVDILVDGKSIGAAGTSAVAAEALPLDRESLARGRGSASPGH